MRGRPPGRLIEELAIATVVARGLGDAGQQAVAATVRFTGEPAPQDLVASGLFRRTWSTQMPATRAALVLSPSGT